MRRDEIGWLGSDGAGWYVMGCDRDVVGRGVLGLKGMEWNAGG